MAEKKTRAVFGLWVETTGDSGYRHWRATVVTVGLNQWELDCAAAGTECRAVLPDATHRRELLVGPALGPLAENWPPVLLRRPQSECGLGVGQPTHWVWTTSWPTSATFGSRS